MPASRMPSATPATRGASGPTTTSSTPCSLAKGTTWAASQGSMPATLVAKPLVPPLPGMQKSSWHWGDWESFLASAASRPPLPSTMMFMGSPFRVLDGVERA